MENGVPTHFHKIDRISETDIIPNGRLLDSLPMSGQDGERVVVYTGSAYEFYQYLNGGWQQSNGLGASLPLAVVDGGTGATTAAGARTNLGAAATSHTHTEADLVLSNVTTDDVSITKHGFAPIAPNDTSKFLRGDATWAALPAGITSKTGGTGADGALSVSSGTTTIDLANQAVVIKNYTTVSITGTGNIAFINPNATGSVVFLRHTGNFTLTSSSTHGIDARGLGGAGGAGASQDIVIAGTLVSGDGSENNDYGNAPIATGKNGLSISTSSVLQNGGGGGSLVTAGTQGALGATGTGTHGLPGSAVSGIALFLLRNQYYNKHLLLISGAGGGGGINAASHGVSSSFGSDGAGGTATSPNGNSGSAGSGGAAVIGGGSGGGGAGGGALYIEVGGSLNFTGTIDASGGSGGNGGAASGGSSANFGGSGGGAGSGGTVVILYNSQTATSGTINVSGGTGGTGGTATGTGATNGGAGGNGGTGFSLLAPNIYFT